MPLNDVLRQRTQAFAGSLNSHRILLYTVVSTIAVSAAIANALKNYSNFYSVAIYLSKSSRSVLVLANFGFLLALLCGHIVQQIFFGALRAPEIERLYDRLWFFITESLLAFTIFRDEFDIPFALMFGFLLFVKSFHWLAADRIEWMDQRPYPGPPPLFHIRMSTLFLILWTTDFLMFLIAVENTVVNGVGGMVLFASEYAILMASVVNAISKYLLSAYELRRAGRRGGENAPPWENKSMWVFYIELATDFLKLTTYLVFFTIIITFYGLPLNIVRDVYITARSFITRLRALHRYQTATRNMDQRYPNATEDEMSAMSDRTCIICREEMVLRGPTANGAGEAHDQAPASPDGPNTTPKKLPCGHIFHFHCLRSWLERQQSCPTCRRTVLETTPQGQQPLAGGAPAPAPQPGAIPQQPNLFGPGAQNPNRINNPLGFVGRLFGPVAQPPIIPGQFAQGHFPQIPNAQNLPQVHGNLALGAGQQPPGVIIQYHIQYQPPRQQQPQAPQPQAPQPLQPAPQFPGFHGPGGVWQPWGMDHRWFGENPPHPGELALDPHAPPVPTPTQPQPGVPPTIPPTPAADHSTRDGESPQTPREAAALAALNRLNTAQLPQRSREPSPSARPATSRSSLASAPRSASPDSRLDIPSLIPLHDYGSYGSASGTYAQTSHVTTRPTGGAQSFSSRHPPGENVSGQPTPGTLPQQPTNRLYSRVVPPRIPSTNSQYNQPNRPRTPISQLPPTLTDDQLAVMDRVTREAIDERLRVLEGVSGAVYRCIDDLMRMRSTLPTLATVSSQPDPQQSTALASTGIDATAPTTTPDSKTSDSDTAMSTPATNSNWRSGGEESIEPRTTDGDTTDP